MTWGRGHQLFNALKALRSGPVSAHKMRISRRQNILVGGGVPTLGFNLSRVQRRILGIRYPALPIVLRKPTGSRRHATDVVIGHTQGHLANGPVSHLPLRVRHHDALHRRMVSGKGLLKLSHILRPVGLHAGIDGVVVGREGRPAQANGVSCCIDQAFVLGLYITDDRTMTCAAHGQGQIALPFDTNGFVADIERCPSLRRSVLTRARSIQLFKVQVLYIRPSIGESPGYTSRAAQHHKRQARQSCAHDIQSGHGLTLPDGCWCFQACKVPNGWRAERQMGVIGQQGFAAFCAVTGDHPVVAAFAFQDTHVAHPICRPLRQSMAIGW